MCVCVCVCLGVAEVERSPLARMQASSLFFLPEETVTAQEEKMEGKEEMQTVHTFLNISVSNVSEC